MNELFDYRVEMIDEENDAYLFECQAEDWNHAAEQALNAYPNDRINWVEKID